MGGKQLYPCTQACLQACGHNFTKFGTCIVPSVVLLVDIHVPDKISGSSNFDLMFVIEADEHSMIMYFNRILSLVSIKACSIVGIWVTFPELPLLHLLFTSVTQGCYEESDVGANGRCIYSSLGTGVLSGHLETTVVRSCTCKSLFRYCDSFDHLLLSYNKKMSLIESKTKLG